MKTPITKLTLNRGITIICFMLLILSALAIYSLYARTSTVLKNREKPSQISQKPLYDANLISKHFESIIFAEGETISLKGVLIDSLGNRITVGKYLQTNGRLLLFFTPSSQRMNWLRKFNKFGVLKNIKFLFLTDLIKDVNETYGNAVFEQFMVFDENTLVLKSSEHIAYFCLLGSDGKMSKIYVPSENDDLTQAYLQKVTKFL